MHGLHNITSLLMTVSDKSPIYQTTNITLEYINFSNISPQHQILCTQQGCSQGGSGGAGEKVQQNGPFYTPNFEDILIICIYLTLSNIIIPKNFQRRFTLHNLIPLLDFLSMHIQNFCWGLQGHKSCHLLFVHMSCHRG